MDDIKDRIKRRYPALSSRDFTLQWIGQFISNSGTQMQLVAINWHIYVLTKSAFSLGLIGLTRFIPFVAFALMAGLASDRFNRKKLLIATETILIVLASILAVATLTKTISPALIYVVSFLSATFMAFELPARQSLIPNLVEKKHLTNALSLGNIAFNLSSVLGPAITGFFIASLGIASAYIFNAISYVIMIGSLLLLTHPGVISGQRAAASLFSIKEGVQFVLSKTMIWSTMILDFFSTFFAEANVLMPIFAKDILKVGPQGLGLLYAAPFFGAMIAGLFVAHAGRIKEQGKILMISVTIYSLSTIIFGVSKLFIASFIALMIMGAGDGVSSIIRSTIRQLITPDYIRGRMNAVNMMFFMGGPQLGEFEAGIVAGLVGASTSVVIGGAGVLAVIIVMSLAVPQLRTYKDAHEILG